MGPLEQNVNKSHKVEMTLYYTTMEFYLGLIPERATPHFELIKKFFSKHIKDTFIFFRNHAKDNLIWQKLKSIWSAIHLFAFIYKSVTQFYSHPLSVSAVSSLTSGHLLSQSEN